MDLCQTHTPSVPTDHRVAVILLSGGLDSATVLAMARAQGFACHALSFDYGQRHRFELLASLRVARALGVVEHKTLKLDLGMFGGSALTSADISVPKHQDVADVTAEAIQHIPITYVPARNTIFLSLALGYAEVIGSTDIFIGVNAVDYSGYPDCRPGFIRAFEHMANLATKACVEEQRILTIHTPLIEMSKAQIIRTGIRLGIDYGMTHSCYDPDPTTGSACGQCDACLLRKQGFKQAGIQDPTPYAPYG